MITRPTLCAILIACSAAAATPAQAQVNNKKLGGQEFTGSVEIAAPPAAVWAKLTDVAKLAAAIKLEVKGGAKKLEKIGDAVQGVADGDQLTLTVVLAKPGAELRLAVDPANGSYICGERWTLEAAGKGTKLTLSERYTESGPQSPQDVAAQVKRWDEVLVALKAAVEAK